MLQQQLSNAQLHSLAAVQQVRGQQPSGQEGGGEAAFHTKAFLEHLYSVEKG